MIRKQDFFAGHPRLQEQFPGGVLQFAQVIGNLPEQEMHDLLMNAQIAQILEEGAAQGALPHGEMPGGLPGDNFVQLDFGGEADIDIEIEGPRAVGAREGRPAANDVPVLDEDEPDDDDDELEEVGIVLLLLLSTVLNPVRLRRCLFVSCAIWWAAFGVVRMLKRKALQKTGHTKKLSWMAWTE
jgi:hypothetical protein